MKLTLAIISTTIAIVAMEASAADLKETGERPPTDEMRDAAAAKALVALSKLVHAAKEVNPISRVVEMSLAGLAFLSSGSSSAAGPYARDIEFCAKYVMQHSNARGTSQSGGDDISSWGYAYAAVFLAELYARDHSAEVAQSLSAVTRELAARQTARGGWCHGSKGPCSKGYSELNAVGNVCLLGLAMAKTAGAPVDEKVTKNGMQYLLESGSDSGGIGYSGEPGMKNTEVGRTAGSILVFAALHQEKNPLYSKMADYLNKNLEKLEDCHQSPCLHDLNGAFASRVLGNVQWQRYWSVYGRKLLDRQRPDGTFDAVKGGFDDKTLETRLTATMALVLCLPHDRLMLLKAKP